MKHLILGLFTAFLTFALPMQEAEAKRFGGGKSSGMQRDSLPQRPASTPQRDAGNASQPGQQHAAPAAAPAQPGKRSWLGPVAGLAAGLGLAALASHLGFGEEMASFLLIALLVMGAFLLFRLFTRKSAPAQPAMQYAGATPGQFTPPPAGNVTPLSSATPAAQPVAPQATSAFPPGFDAEAFARQAKLNFLRLQAAYDAGNLDDIRDFTSPEMYAEIQLQLAERGQGEQRTEVKQLEVDVLECAEEDQRLRVSVRFHGLIQEERDAPATTFDEVWHLTRPSQGNQGWLVSGIQQMA